MHIAPIMFNLTVFGMDRVFITRRDSSCCWCRVCCFSTQSFPQQKFQAARCGGFKNATNSRATGKAIRVSIHEFSKSASQPLQFLRKVQLFHERIQVRSLRQSYFRFRLNSDRFQQMQVIENDVKQTTGHCKTLGRNTLASLHC